MLAISPAADNRLMWDLLAVAPTSAEGARMSSVGVQRILKANRIRKVSADEVLTALRTAPLILAPGSAESAFEHFQLLLLEVKTALLKKVFRSALGSNSYRQELHYCNPSS